MCPSIYLSIHIYVDGGGARRGGGRRGPPGALSM